MSGANNPDCKTLWMGDIEPWMDEAYISSVFAQVGLGNTLTSVKVIKDKTTGLPAGYGFVEFNSHEMAQHVYQTYNGGQIPSTNKFFRLNWASHGSRSNFGSTGNRMQTGGPTIMIGPGPSGGVVINSMHNPPTPPPPPPAVNMSAYTPVPEVSVYVGDLDPNVTDQVLLELFKQRFPSTSSAKVIIDGMTKHSKGYGFVKFRDNEEAQRAIALTNGMILYGKSIKVSNAFSKGSATDTGSAMTQSSSLAATQSVVTSAPLPPVAQPPPLPTQLGLHGPVPPTSIQEHPQHFLQAAKQQQLYQYYYSVLSDPQKRAELQKLLEQQYGLDMIARSTGANKKKSIKVELETIKAVDLESSMKSMGYLETLPKMSIYKSKMDILNSTLH